MSRRGSENSISHDHSTFTNDTRGDDKMTFGMGGTIDTSRHNDSRDTMRQTLEGGKKFVKQSCHVKKSIKGGPISTVVNQAGTTKLPQKVQRIQS
jgi:hypothetical protein